MLATIAYPPIPVWDVGPLKFSLHGVFAAVGFFVGFWVVARMLEKRGFDSAGFQSLAVWILLGGLLGARLLTAPAALLDGAGWAALNPVVGNYSIMGGFVGGIVVGVWRMRRLGLPLLPILDVASFGLAWGTVVGRIGDLAIVEHLGRATDAAWGYEVRPGYDLAPQHNGLECTVAEAGADGVCGIYHHVALYDMLGAGVLLLVLWLVYRRTPLRYGQMFSLWVVWYGLQRLLLDSLRFGMGDAELGGFTWNQVSALAGAAIGVALWAWFRSRQPKVSSQEDEERGAFSMATSEEDSAEDHLRYPPDAQ
ncbi:MAG: prolipoprotein diacylglyceryl transferase [bacterium]|nr:prolipoprotein diacylglyceryl transferase [Acidimicrobiia bacterium]MCY4651041.1 prolipoprotein diacylglyceryl transferase [bacterium]